MKNLLEPSRSDYRTTSPAWTIQPHRSRMRAFKTSTALSPHWTQQPSPNLSPSTVSAPSPTWRLASAIFISFLQLPSITRITARFKTSLETLSRWRELLLFLRWGWGCGWGSRSHRVREVKRGEVGTSLFLLRNSYFVIGTLLLIACDWFEELITQWFSNSPYVSLDRKMF